MTSVASLDSMRLDQAIATSAPARAGAKDAGVSGRRAELSSVRQIDARTFELRSGVWTDARYRDDMRTLRVAPFSKSYFALLDKLPDLRAVFALGDSVIVVGRSGAIKLDVKAGEVSEKELDGVVAGW